jgi:hypothetical protein
MDEATMTIRRRSGQTMATEAYALDGTETRTESNGRVTKARAAWQGSRLVIDIEFTAPVPNGEPVITVSTRALWREADVLVSETTFKSPIQLRTLSHYRHPSTEPQASLTPAAADIAAMAWLAGTWTSASGGTTEEAWTPPAGGAMLGTSRTIARERMVAFEFLRVVERDGTLVYIAQPGGRPPTEFTLTAISPVEDVFENPAHDYPKVIRYRREGDDAMVARISDTGGLRPQEFRFQRQGR